MSWKSRASLAFGCVTPMANSGPGGCSVTNDGWCPQPCVSSSIEEVPSVTSCSYRYTRRCRNTGPNVWIPNRLTVGYAWINPKSYRREKKRRQGPKEWMWVDRWECPRNAVCSWKVHAASVSVFIPLMGFVITKSSETHSPCPGSHRGWNKSPCCLLFKLAGSGQ